MLRHARTLSRQLAPPPTVTATIAALQFPPHRDFATGYLAQKKAAKNRRRQLYKKWDDRRKRLATRRDATPNRGKTRQGVSILVH